MNISKKIRLIGCLLCLQFAVFSQNLVPDGSFEDYKRCPSSITSSIRKFPLLNWYIPTHGTSDYFNKCCRHDGCTVPRNAYGTQEPRTGDGYVGILSKRIYSEYVSSELKHSLKKDREYYVEFWVSLAEDCKFSSRRIGLYFSTGKPTVISTTKPLSWEPQVVSSSFITEVEQWVKISGTFKANGNEKFITIGCFHNGSKDFCKVKKSRERTAGYYIDDVLVVDIDSINYLDKKPDSIPLNKTAQVLKNLTFPTNSSIINESSYSELDSLQHYLEQNPKLKIELSGYTDNIGKEQDNLLLSQARVKAVAEYLISKGIETERVSYKGYGSQHPISTNETEEGRKQNRRVEFKLYE